MSLLSRLKKLEVSTDSNASVMTFSSVVNDDGKEVFTQGSIEEMYRCIINGEGYRHIKTIGGKTVEEIVPPYRFVQVEQDLSITPEEAYKLIMDGTE